MAARAGRPTPPERDAVQDPALVVFLAQDRPGQEGGGDQDPRRQRVPRQDPAGEGEHSEKSDRDEDARAPEVGAVELLYRAQNEQEDLSGNKRPRAEPGAQGGPGMGKEGDGDPRQQRDGQPHPRALDRARMEDAADFDNCELAGPAVQARLARRQPCPGLRGT